MKSIAQRAVLGLLAAFVLLSASVVRAQKPSPNPIVFKPATQQQIQAISAARNAGKTRPLSEPQRKACAVALNNQYPQYALNCLIDGGIYQESELKRGRFYCRSYVYVIVCSVVFVYELGVEEGTCADFNDDDDGPLT